MTDLVFREAEAGDQEQIVDLLAEIMRHHGVGPPAREELRRVVTAVLDAASHTFYVADRRGEVLGLCALLFSLSTWRAVQVCELQDVVVTAGARDLGVGRELVRQALEFARARGCAWAYLSAESWNLGAHDFYRSLGFREKTVLYFEYDLSGAPLGGQ